MSYLPPTLTLPPLGRGDLNRLIDSWNGYNNLYTKLVTKPVKSVENVEKAAQIFRTILEILKGIFYVFYRFDRFDDEKSKVKTTFY